ncbi:MAG: hypothetical protein ABIO70_01230 [Pseudomonadota bacterium]
MRALSLLLLFAGALNLVACGDDKPTDTGPEGDADTDADTDSDTDTDVTEPGGDIASAATFTLDADGAGSYDDVIGTPGDRDFYFIQPEAGSALQIWTESYVLDEDGEPDTVIRLYDASGNFLVEDDDFPYWAMGTDSGIYYQVPTADGFYVEVLEWNDWAGESPSGGASFEYTLNTKGVVLDGWEWAANGSMEEADAMLEEWAADPHSYEFWEWQFDETPESAGYAFWQVFGEIGEAGDQDWWPLPVSKDLAGTFMQVSLWDTDFQGLDPVVTVYDAEGSVLARSVDPSYGASYGYVWSYPAAIVFRAPTDGVYYVVVENEAGTGGAGAGYFYPLICSPGWSFNEDPWETEANDPIGLAETLSMKESTTTEGFYYAIFAGALDEEIDASDNFMFRSSDTNGLDGKYLSVMLDTDVMGSTLDAKITLFEDQGGANFVEIASATVDPDGVAADSPCVFDYELTSDNNIYITVENENLADPAGPGHYYYGAVYVSDDPVHD